jgi:hypothetical protein
MRKMAIKPTIVAPIIPSGALLRAINSPRRPAIKAISSLTSKCGKVIVITYFYPP